MFWMIAAIVVPTVASIGASIGGSVKTNEEINKQIENQKDNTLMAAWTKWGTSFAPPPIR